MNNNIDLRQQQKHKSGKAVCTNIMHITSLSLNPAYQSLHRLLNKSINTTPKRPIGSVAATINRFEHSNLDWIENFDVLLLDWILNPRIATICLLIFSANRVFLRVIVVFRFRFPLRRFRPLAALSPETFSLCSCY